jgi:hypothetical protein|nr:MAG TPA: hypothetical protein [Caudoviricetes sp.]
MNEDFSLGKMNADARLTATFKYYEKKEQDGKIMITAYLGEGDVPKLKRGYGLDGNELWLSLNNLYQNICGKDDNSAAADIISWCQHYAHPYYASQGIEEYKWDIEKDTEYWDFSTNILGNFTFDVRTMRKDLETLYRDTLVILMFKKCLERLDVSNDLAQITWTNAFVDFNSFPTQTHLSKISSYLNKMNGTTIKLGLDENGELKVMPDFHSVFDAARFALSQYVSIPMDYPIAYAERVGIATCECCGRLFIKNGNRQKYCDNPECKKERNRRKSRTSYHRKIQEENDNRWA